MIREPLTELERYRKQFLAIRAAAAELGDRLADASFTWQPRPGVWSVSECLEHLTRFGRFAENRIQGMISAAQERGLRGQGPFRHGLPGSWLIRLIEPPYRIRFKAVRASRPLAPGAKSAVLPAFLAHQARMLELLAAAEGLDLAAVQAPVPPTCLRLTLGQWFALVAAHGRRHLWQAEQICRLPGFPG